MLYSKNSAEKTYPDASGKLCLLLYLSLYTHASRRKAALCHMKMADWTAALDLISLCPKEEASTHYLAFLAAIRQGGCETFQPFFTTSYIVFQVEKEL